MIFFVGCFGTRHPVAERIRTTEDVLKDVHCNWGRDGRDGGRQGMTWSCDKAALSGNVEDRIMTYVYEYILHNNIIHMYISIYHDIDHTQHTLPQAAYFGDVGLGVWCMFTICAYPGISSCQEPRFLIPFCRLSW